jgi:hypothetical protein
VYVRSELFVAGFAGTYCQSSLTLYDAKVALCHTNGTPLFATPRFQLPLRWPSKLSDRSQRSNLKHVEDGSLKDVSPSHQHPFLAGGVTRRFQVRQRASSVTVETSLLA